MFTTPIQQELVELCRYSFYVPLVTFSVVTSKALCFVKWGISDSKINGYVLGGRGLVLGWSTDFPVQPL